jgi:predicted RNA binding protein YcfA (HicA-like mRNA interferase family)
MTQAQKILEKILRGDADANIDFDALISILKKLGFQERIKGSHHICYKDGIEEIINLQPKGSKAKPYQVKQVRNLVLKYKLAEIL